MSGVGIYFNSTDGVLVCGELRNGQGVGNVTKFMPEDFYVGEVNEKMLRNGFGTSYNYANPDSPIYKGEWADDQQHGDGTRYDG